MEIATSCAFADRSCSFKAYLRHKPGKGDIIIFAIYLAKFGTTVLCADVYKLDRFSRNKYEMAIHRKHLKDNGIKILSAKENIPETPEGVLLESLLEGYEHSNGHNKKSNMD